MSDKDELGAFLLGFVIGGLAGAVASLLLAPQSGEETRAVIKTRAIEIRDKAETSLEETYAQAEAAAAEARARFEELAQVAKERADEIRVKGTQVVGQLKKVESDAPPAVEEA